MNSASQNTLISRFLDDLVINHKFSFLLRLVLELRTKQRLIMRIRSTSICSTYSLNPGDHFRTIFGKSIFWIFGHFFNIFNILNSSICSRITKFGHQNRWSDTGEKNVHCGLSDGGSDLVLYVAPKKI